MIRRKQQPERRVRNGKNKGRRKRKKEISKEA